MILSEKEAHEKVNQGRELKQAIDNLNLKFDAIKEELINYAIESRQTKLFDAENLFYAHVVKKPVFKKLVPLDVWHKLEKLGKAGKFFDCCSIVMGALKKVIGQDDIDELLGEPTGDQYSISFKKKKEAK